MAAKLGVLIIHGIGTQDSDFADPTIKKLKRQLDDLEIKQNEVQWQTIHWAPVLDKKQTEIWQALSSDNDLDYTVLRKFVINVLGDAVAYQRVPGQARETIYDEIHAIIHQSIKTLRQALGSDKPLVILAHSLGCYMISNYIWDRQQGIEQQVYGNNAFERVETLAGIVTFGCNIPLFMLAYRDIEPITFPSSMLEAYFPDDTPRAKLVSAARWLNFYDPDDILAYPLRPLSPQYAKTVNRDIAINTGGIFASWNPSSHTQYWTDNSLIEPAAKLIGDLLKLL